jgi:Protein of unknown function (DUF2721)
MSSIIAVDNIAHNIQLAVAPMFLLAGIGSILNVMMARLGRVVDRSHKLETEISAYPAEIPGYPSVRRDKALRELRMLDQRMMAANLAIMLCTSSALLVCVTVALLFIGDLFPIRSPLLVALLFTTAMLLLIAGLTVLLYEVRMGLASVRRRAQRIIEF